MLVAESMAYRLYMRPEPKARASKPSRRFCKGQNVVVVEDQLLEIVVY
jgi:hypothetical protein